MGGKGSTDKFGTTILTHLFCPHFGGKSSTEHHSASGFPPRSDEKIYANLADLILSVIPKQFRCGQDGFASALGLCILALLILIAMTAASLIRSGGTVAAEYEREMQLRLAAESGVLTAADTLEHRPSAAGKLPAEDAVHDVPMAADIDLHVVIEPQKDGTIWVSAAAVDRRHDTDVSDGEHWTRAKIVRAQMEKKDGHYVWRRWF
ncbi:hypothetical protein [uncultured Selenomonas sp.]|uniref:hypothetical protein n=1 Tax=uncultured Selenomonas sp. TaxID=159275 RepID=UPI0028D286E8|nr:hypothetical protein [uncultured Selenomonas sp.]